MSYATQQDLVDRFGATEIIQRTDRLHRPPTTIDPVVVERALDDATALIDGYLKALYALPLSAVPPVLVKVCADIARYNLWGEAVNKDGPVAMAYRDALAWLRDVATGKVQLDADGVSPAASASGARMSASEPDFTRQNLKGFI